MSSRAALLILGCTTWILAGCPEQKVPPPAPATLEPARCEIDVGALPQLFAQDGTGARAARIDAEVDLIGGQFAQGRAGDFLLENDRIRVVVGAPSREISHSPFGGNILDADLKRPSGEPGRDQLGELGLFYAFGRSPDVRRVEVVRDGRDGGPAVIAATGVDALNDYMTLKSSLDRQQLGIALVVDPETPQPVRTTTWYVLSPGEARVRIFTAFCNDGDKPATFPVGEISAGGGTMDFFNPAQCRGGLGESDCLVDPAPWFGWQGTDVAYGFRSYDFEDPATAQINALVYLSGSAATLAGAGDLQGVLAWVDPEARTRPGALRIPPGGQKGYLRDLVVTRDLAGLSDAWLSLDDAPRGQLEVQVTGSEPGIETRVAVLHGGNGKLETVGVTDAEGRARLTLKPGTWRVAAAQVDRRVTQAVTVEVPAAGSATAALTLEPLSRLKVTVTDPSGVRGPAKVVVRCPGGSCPVKARDFAPFLQLEPRADDLAAIAYVPPSGVLELALPPSVYEVLVSRGPEYSGWPDTFPNQGREIDLGAGDVEVNAVIARVVDTSGWISADLHVHSVHSADASPALETRVLSSLAEGVETLVSTDHDFVTDYAPAVRSLQASELISTIIGNEITPTWGHLNAFPVARDGTPNGGATDWAGGEGPSLRPQEVLERARLQTPGTFVQLNHPRGTHGVLTNLKVDTLTGASQSDPAAWRMAPAPGATETNTRLFSTAFDGMELQNGQSPSFAVINDWMTFLSRGVVKTGTAVSDTHTGWSAPVGYGRTFVQVDADEATTLDVDAFIARLRAHRAVGTNGPFVTVSAVRLGAGGEPLGAPVGVGGTLSVSAGERVQLSVDVQAPEWMQFDRIELYTHAAGREAKAGESNGTWPATRIAQHHVLDPLTLPVEALPGPGPEIYRRVRVSRTFEVTPTADAWYVVMVRSTSAARDLFPLAFRSSCSEALCSRSAPRAFAFTNPVFVDADGSGAYDVFPLPMGQGLQRRSPLPPPVPRWIPSVEEAEAILRELLRHDEN